MPPEVALAAERLAGRLLARADSRPGAHAFEVARRLGHSIEIVDRLPGNARGGRDPETCAILLAPCSNERRLQLTACHELIEHYVPARLDPRWHEAFCQRGAAAIMMPARDFVASAMAFHLSMPQLAHLWTHCSREAILTRLADLLPNCSVGSWRGSMAKFRRASYLPHNEAAEVEHFVAAEAAYSRRESFFAQGRIAARAWPVGDDRALSVCVTA